MEVNRQIIVGVVILMATGAYQLLVVKSVHTTLVRIIVGGFMLGVIASALDAFGGGAGQIAGWIVMLAVATSILVVIADLATRFGGAAATQTGGSSGGGSSHTVK